MQKRPDESVRGRLHVACGAQDSHAFVSVSDTGPGIPVELRQRVFEPLFSTKSFGTGLGLPLVQQVLEQHGGHVKLADGDDGGSVVSLILPLGEEPAKPMQVEASS